MPVCDRCLTAAMEDGADPDNAGEVCQSFGADIADHTCEMVETDGETKCLCQCSADSLAGFSVTERVA